jgi:uncharacterized OB-fold protein
VTGWFPALRGVMKTSHDQVPIQEGLFTWPSADPRLIARRETKTDRLFFPAIHNYVKAEDSTEFLLSTVGTLWSWTVQSFMPTRPPYRGKEAPEQFRPYGVGYIEIPNEVIVEARLTESDPKKLRIGMKMRLTFVPFGLNERGQEIVTFAFEPFDDNPSKQEQK